VITRVALTGGIGVGKSTVCRLFARLGIPILDADDIARELVAPGMPALEDICRAFGDQILAPDGTLDRPRLRAIVFADAECRKRLEAILHPRVYEEMQRRAEGIDAPYIVYCIPLLVESGRAHLFDRVIVVDAPPDLQLRRIMSRDQLTVQEAEAIIRAQTPRAERLAVADVVLVNNSDLGALEQQVLDLHRRCLEDAARRD
jgi:dephospho-CoA kinase